MEIRDRKYRAAGFEVPQAPRVYVRTAAHVLIDHVRKQIGVPGDVFPIVRLIEYWGTECGSVPGEDMPNYVVCDPHELPHGDAEFRVHENTIYIDRDVWDAASNGDPEARSVLAHETGHVVLKHYPAAGRYNHDYRVVQAETDSEHQANWFADELMMDNRCIVNSDGVDSLIAKFDVSADMATRRIRDWMLERKQLR